MLVNVRTASNKNCALSLTLYLDDGKFDPIHVMARFVFAGSEEKSVDWAGRPTPSVQKHWIDGRNAIFNFYCQS